MNLANTSEQFLSSAELLAHHVRTVARNVADMTETDEESVDTLTESVYEALCSLSPANFETLKVAVSSMTPSRDEQDRIAENLEVAVATVCEVLPELNDNPGYLVMLPLLAPVSLSGGDSMLSKETRRAVAKTLKETGLVSKNAAVKILPRLIPADTAQRLSPTEVLVIGRALHYGETQSALKLIDNVEGFSPVKDAKSGALVFAVYADEDDALLPLSETFDLSMDRINEGLLQDPEIQQEAAELAAQVSAISHSNVADALAVALNMPELILLGTANGWFNSRDSLARIWRERVALEPLLKAAFTQSNGKLNSLIIQSERTITLDDNADSVIPVARTSDREWVSSFSWPALPDEPALDRLIELEYFAAKHGIWLTGSNFQANPGFSAAELRFHSDGASGASLH